MDKRKASAAKKNNDSSSVAPSVSLVNYGSNSGVSGTASVTTPSGFAIGDYVLQIIQRDTGGIVSVDSNLTLLDTGDATAGFFPVGIDYSFAAHGILTSVPSSFDVVLTGSDEWLTLIVGLRNASKPADDSMLFEAANDTEVLLDEATIPLGGAALYGLSYDTNAEERTHTSDLGDTKLLDVNDGVVNMENSMWIRTTAGTFQPTLSQDGSADTMVGWLIVVSKAS